MMTEKTERAVRLLQKMVRIPSTSRGETEVADLIEMELKDRGFRVRRYANNLVVIPDRLDTAVPTVMLNSHIDTVKPSPSYTFDPYAGDIREGKIWGLGSNDAGASVVSLIEAFCEMWAKMSNCNLILCLSAEEEVGGENGMRLLLPSLSEEGVKPDMAIVGEPTGLQPAIAERGLIVLDCVTRGVTGHAARNEGVNALYNAMDDIVRLRNFKFPKVSEVLGPVKISVTQMECGRQHNVVPDECRWVVDVRTTDAYTNRETADMLQGAVSHWTTATPRSTRVQASVIDTAHPLTASAIEMGLKPFISPTTSDMSLMHDFPSLKIGPGESSRSHTADEFVMVEEIEAGIGIYIELLTKLDNKLKK